jgi:hypothetical protein
MSELKNQPTKFPTRKILAVIIAGALVGGLQSALQLLWPDHPFSPLMQDIDLWVQYGVMALAGYMTKERGDV